MSIHLSVIIPAYNEEQRIVKTLASVQEYLALQPYTSEIIVVDDGSTDKTKQVALKVQIINSKLHVLGNTQNRGKGFVVRQGLLAAQGHYRLFMDADHATPIAEVAKLLRHAKTHDMVIGSRSLPGATIVQHQPLHRRLLGNLYWAMAALITGLHGFHDTQCGFKLVSARCANDVLPKCQANGWSFDVELLLCAKRLGYRIKEVPIAWADGRQSKMRILGMMASVIELFAIRKNTLLGKYGRDSSKA